MGNCVALFATCLLVYSQHTLRINSIRCQLCWPPHEQQSWEGPELCLRSCNNVHAHVASVLGWLCLVRQRRAQCLSCTGICKHHYVQSRIRCHKRPFWAGRYQRPNAPSMCCLFPNTGCLCMHRNMGAHDCSNVPGAHASCALCVQLFQPGCFTLQFYTHVHTLAVVCCRLTWLEISFRCPLATLACSPASNDHNWPIGVIYYFALQSTPIQCIPCHSKSSYDHCITCMFANSWRYGVVHTHIL